MATPLIGTAPLLEDNYFLQTVEILTATGTLNIKSLVVEISYYEDIFRGSVTGEVLISDSISIIDRVGMCGNEFLNLTFSKNKTQTESEKVSKKFRIYRVSERILKNQETENYTLHFCSEEFFLSEQMKISKAYKGKLISDIASDILKNELKTTDYTVQGTTGLYDLIIPYKSPFESLHWLCNYAMSQGDSGADFLFFENKDGFNFTSLQELYKKREYNFYKYNVRNIDSPLSGGDELKRNLTSIKSYTYLDTFDTLYGITNGAFASKTLTIDPLTRKFYETNFDYKNDYFFKNVQLNDFSVINNLKNKNGKTVNEMYDSTFKVLISNKEQDKAKLISEQPWSVQKDINAEKFVPYRTAQLALSNYTRVKISVPGDPKLSIGTIIFLELPSSAAKRDGSGLNEGSYDAYNSGRYLISAVRHVIKADMTYDTVLEVVKDSMASSLPNWDSGTNNDVLKG
jgi:hypothetical protein